MKIKEILSIIILPVILFITGCDLITHFQEEPGDTNQNAGNITGSGNLVSIEESFTNFNTISLSHSFNAEVVQSDSYYVRLKVDDNVVQYLRSYQEGSTIYLGLINGSYNNITLIAEIGMPDISSVFMSGATRINLDGFQFDHSFNIDISGASVVTGNISTGNLYCSLSGASSVEIIGEGKDVNIVGSGASNINLLNFPAENINIHLSGASVSTVNTSGIMNVSLSGVSRLWYRGNPTFGSLEISGSSSITKI
ncbi:GIN domain-containing protein [Bacteroidota bacterium]